MSGRVLLVEDDRALREALADALALEGFAVTSAGDGTSGGELVFTRHFDLVILDLMLPGRGGLEILKEIRAEKLGVPVLLLTVRSDENDKVLGFELGADDYVTKPFGLRELVARIKALMRRGTGSGLPDRSAASRARFQIGEAVVDLGRYELELNGKTSSLSPKEAEILRLLHAEEGRAVSRNRFLTELWGDDAAVTNRTIDTHVLHLRQKIEGDPAAPQHILTVHGVGYRLVAGVEGSDTGGGDDLAYAAQDDGGLGGGAVGGAGSVADASTCAPSSSEGNTSKVQGRRRRRS